MLSDVLRQAGPAALVGMFIGLVPLGFGILYALRPSERRLALMRPLSLAAIFGSISSTTMGFTNYFRWVGTRGESALSRVECREFHAVVRGEAKKEHTVNTALPKVASQSSVCDAAVIKESAIAVDLAIHPFPKNLGPSFST